MKIRTACLWLLTAALPIAAHAENVFVLSFHGTGRLMNNSGRIQNRRVTADDLIARCVGDSGLRTNNSGTNRQFELVYNPDSDSVQVVSLTNGGFLCDVFQFQGGISNVDHRQINRLAFVFIPEQNESVGSAIVNERIRNRPDRKSLQGQIEFALPSLDLASGAGAQFETVSPAPGVGNPNTVGSGNTNAAGGSASNNSSSGVTNLPVTAPTVPTPSSSPDTNIISIGTNALSSAGNAGLTNSLVVTPPLPSASSPSPTNAAGSINTNASSSSPANSVSATNSLAVSATNEVSNVMVTNAVIISGSFSTGRRVVMNDATP